MNTNENPTTIDYEVPADVCPVCRASGALTPCYNEKGPMFLDHPGRPVTAVWQMLAEED